MLLTPKAEIDERIGMLQKEMENTELEGAIILLNSDMYYLTGTVQNAHLFVPLEGEPVLMVRKSLNRAREESPLTNIVAMERLKDLPGIVQSFYPQPLSRLGMELDVLPVNNFAIYQRLFPSARITDVSPLIKKIRLIKSPHEVDLIRESLRVLDMAYREVPRVLREGMAEIELASYFEATLRRGGMSGLSKMRAFNQDYFMGNICAGRSGAYASGFDGSVSGSGASPASPQGPGYKAIQRNEVIYIDYACSVNGYNGDQTRIFCLGRLEPKMVKAHQDALLINAELLKALRPGVLAEEAYFQAVKIAEELGYKDNFLGYQEDRARFIGHGVGLDLDELPVLAPGVKMPLQPGMTFALEPKFVFPEGAIGTENTFVMTENGPENISITPQHIIYLD